MGELLVASSVNKRLSTIAAYWPGMGTSITFDPLLKLLDKDRPCKKTHIFGQVLWYQYHNYPDYFGSSAIVSTKLFEMEGPCCFLPLTRIANRCAAGEIEIDFPQPFGTNKVFCCYSTTI